VPIPAEVFLEDERGSLDEMLTSSFRKGFFVAKSLEVQRPLANG
jgi:hypothetical protein